MTPSSAGGRRRAIGAAVALATIGAAPFAAAQGTTAYPTKPIRIVVPAAPGGGTDALGRLLGDALATALRQTVVVDNRPGANGTIASDAVARAPADGHTLLVVQNGHAINPATTRKLPYDTLKDFTPIATLARSPLVLVASGVTGVRTLKDLDEFAKRDPGRVTFGSAEASTRLASQRLRNTTGIAINVVPYKGTAPTVADIVGGHLNFAVTTIASTLPFKDSDKLHYVAVLAARRAPFLPNVPTLAEQGVSDVDVSGWWGVVGPANLPRAVVDRLNATVAVMLADPDAKAKIAALAAEPWASSAAEFDRFLRDDVAANLELARQAGIEPE